MQKKRGEIRPCSKQFRLYIYIYTGPCSSSSGCVLGLAPVVQAVYWALLQAVKAVYWALLLAVQAVYWALLLAVQAVYWA